MDLKKIKKEEHEWIGKEIVAHLKMDHPHIVKMIDHCTKGDHVFVLLEHAENGSLFTYQYDHKPLSLPFVTSLFRQVVQAIGHIHSKGIIHRDIKPENILLNGRLDAKVCDFGLSVEMTDFEQRKQRCGTYEYMSPEGLNKMLQGQEIDLWALGVLLYELTHDKPPFPGSNAIEVQNSIKMGLRIDGKVPQAAQDIIRKLLDADPKKRPTPDQILNHEFLNNNHGGLLESNRLISGNTNSQGISIRSSNHSMASLSSRSGALSIAVNYSQNHINNQPTYSYQGSSSPERLISYPSVHFDPLDSPTNVNRPRNQKTNFTLNPINTNIDSPFKKNRQHNVVHATDSNKPPSNYQPTYQSSSPTQPILLNRHFQQQERIVISSCKKDQDVYSQGSGQMGPQFHIQGIEASNQANQANTSVDKLNMVQRLGLDGKNFPLEQLYIPSENRNLIPGMMNRTVNYQSSEQAAKIVLRGSHNVTLSRQ